MGAKAEIGAWLKPWPLRVALLWLVCAVFVLPGCENINPPPDIEIEQSETNEWTGVTVYYKHHQVARSVYVTLDTPQDVVQYKKKVEFLLKRLDEVELRMGIYEDEAMQLGQ